MERLRFPRVTFTHVPVLRVRILNERGGGGSPLLKSATHEGRRFRFAAQEETKSPFFVFLRRVLRLWRYQLVQTYTLNVCLFTLPSFREIFSLHYTKRTTHAHTHSHHHHHHGGRRRNRNVRFPSGNQPTVEFDHQRASSSSRLFLCAIERRLFFSFACVFFSRANLCIVLLSRTSVFSHLCARDDADPFLSLFNALINADVLLEQRDLFARIDQVRVLLSKTERGERKREANVSLTRRFVILFPIGGGLDCLSRDDD